MSRSKCPIALALYDQLGTDVIVAVSLFTCTVRKSGGTLCRYILPNEAVAFVSNFDSGKPVDSLTFILMEYP